MKIDNFALTMHQSCPAKYDLRIGHGYRSRYKSPALSFGAAVHGGMAEWYKTGNIELAERAVHATWEAHSDPDDYRTVIKACDVMREYVEEYPRESFTIVGAPSHPLIEVPFTLDTGLSTNSGDPIEYGGIFDTLIEFNGQIYILEHKTCSRMGPGYFDQFKPNNQITGYVWAAQKLSGRRVGGAIVNAMCVQKGKSTIFRREITTRSELDIERWLRDLNQEANNIEANGIAGHWPMRTPSCTQYGKCEFHSVHVLSNELQQVRRLESDYIVEKWDYEAQDR